MTHTAPSPSPSPSPLPSAAWRGFQPDELLVELVDIEALVAQLTRRPAWHERAACRGVGPEVFYIGRGESTEPARAFCSSCDVIDECRRWIDDHEPRHHPVGVWAGESGKQRRARRRGAKQANNAGDDGLDGSPPAAELPAGRSGVGVGRKFVDPPPGGPHRHQHFLSL